MVSQARTVWPYGLGGVFNVTEMTGGQALAKSLAREGVKVIFGLPGVQLYHAMEGLEAEPSIRFITTRHEQGTTYMADGYSRTSGEVGTSLVVPGPGVLNAAAGLSDAYAASAPVFLVSGQINRDGIGQNKGILHEINDQLDVVRTITKWCARVLDPADIPGAVHEAFHQMKTGRPRPVEVEIPPETFAQVADIELQEPGVYGPLAPDSGELERAAALIAKSQRIAIWAGGGAIWSRSNEALTRLAEHLQAPVITTPEGKGAISARHYLSLGTCRGGVNPQGDVMRKFIANECDLVIAVGTRFIAPGLDASKSVLQIDVDPEEIGRNHPNTQPLVGDAHLSLDGLYDMLSSQPARASRRAETEAFRQERHDVMMRTEPQSSLMRALRDNIPDDGIVAMGQTQVGYYSHAHWPAYEQATYLTSSYQGNLGFAFPTAMGAKVANPDRAVVSVSGDGGFQFASNELSTAVQHGINIVAVVFNDGAFGNVLREMETLFDGRSLGSHLYNPDFVKLAEAYGVDGMRAHGAEELGGCVREALNNNRPTLIEVPVQMMPRPY